MNIKKEKSVSILEALNKIESEEGGASETAVLVELIEQGYLTGVPERAPNGIHSHPIGISDFV